MRSLEISARSIEEAVDLALKKLGVSREEVKVVVLKRGRSGVFGLGAEEARVRVTTLIEGMDEVAELAKEVLERLLALMGIPAVVHLVEGAPSISLDIRGENLGVLIGRRGQTLSSLQYLVNLIVAHDLKERVPITVDVEGYRQHRNEALEGLALRMAERVRTTKQSVTLEPMPAAERRVIHLALAELPDVLTMSVGEGETRKVTILPKG